MLRLKGKSYKSHLFLLFRDKGTFCSPFLLFLLVNKLLKAESRLCSHFNEPLCFLYILYVKLNPISKRDKSKTWNLRMNKMFFGRNLVDQTDPEYFPS